jgi:CMP-N,N'-diacetyllegionaminic acid synthase
MMPEQPSIIGLIPARAGSKRIKDKNIRKLGDHPVLAYAISAALESGVFDKVIVSTDSEPYAAIARHYGAEVPFLRPAEFATATSPDFEWIDHLLLSLRKAGRNYDCFSILRPSSPLRQADTIRRAWAAFCKETGVDSLRAVEKVRQHPGKMWVIRGNRMVPLLPLTVGQQPWHSMQMASLPEVYVQNASLEIAHCSVVFEQRNIAGSVIMPFVTNGLEGFDLNDPEDWWLLQHLLSTGEAKLPDVAVSPFCNELQ